MNYNEFDNRYQLDILAEKAGGYVSPPDQEDIEFTNLFFDICRQFGIRYASAAPKERLFIDEITRATWEYVKARKSESKG